MKPLFIRFTLQLDLKGKIHDADVRRASLEYWNEFAFLVARSDSSNTDFNCRKCRCVSRQSSGVSRPFSPLRDRCSLFRPMSRVSELHEVWSGECIEKGELINWFIDWLIGSLIDCSSLNWYGTGGVNFWCAQGFDIWWMVVGVRTLNGTKSGLVWFLFYDDCLSFLCIRMKWTSPIPMY